MTGISPVAHPSSDSSAERAAIVGLAFGSRRRVAVETSLVELAGLAMSAGAVVVHQSIQERDKPDPAFFLGRGKAESLGTTRDALSIDVVIFDDELTPVQLRNLEETVGCRVIDRTQLILDIFASRARTREGKLQVELAQLRYRLPRLTGSGVMLSRLGGGIGTRGPGETKLETDRRRIRHRIARLSRDLDTVREHRARLRDRRHKGSVPTVALVGYTNAGKTSVFNMLTSEGVPASPALFATLDPLLRPVRLPDQRTALVSDTVGFIDRLPHTLVAAFRATLEEVAAADLLLLIVDASDPDYEARMDAVVRVLDEVGVGELQRLLVFNKMDLLGPQQTTRLQQQYPEAVCVSALTGGGRHQVVQRIMQAVQLQVSRVTLELDDEEVAGDPRLAQVYRHGRILRYVNEGGRVAVEAEVPTRLIAQWP